MNNKNFSVITKGRKLKQIAVEIQKALDAANSKSSNSPKVHRSLRLKDKEVRL